MRRLRFRFFTQRVTIGCEDDSKLSFFVRGRLAVAGAGAVAVAAVPAVAGVVAPVSTSRW